MGKNADEFWWRGKLFGYCSTPIEDRPVGCLDQQRGATCNHLEVHCGLAKVPYLLCTGRVS